MCFFAYGAKNSVLRNDRGCAELVMAPTRFCGFILGIKRLDVAASVAFTLNEVLYHFFVFMYNFLLVS